MFRRLCIRDAKVSKERMKDEKDQFQALNIYQPQLPLSSLLYQGPCSSFGFYMTSMTQVSGRIKDEKKNNNRKECPLLYLMYNTFC
jgi:hypothetical protein